MICFFNVAILNYTKKILGCCYENNLIIIRNLLLSFIVAVVMLGCNKTQNHKAEEMNINNVVISEETKEAMNIIKDSRILFSHQSVGYNILSGVKMISDKTGIEINVKNVDDVSLGNNKIFAHVTGGKNYYPKTKIDSFTKKISELNGESIPDVAFMKFCYVDVKPDTDVNELFKYYQEKINEIKKEKPGVTLIHLTVPLVTRSNTMKSKIKRLLGMDKYSETSNIKRNDFNDLLTKSFHGEPIFDIARVESTHKDGSREQFIEDGKVYYRMASEYTKDGGHLNDLGQYVVATEMVNFLGDTIKRTKKK